MTALAAVAAIVAALYGLRAVERRHAAREAERLTVMRQLREWRPPQPRTREPPRLTSCPMHPMPGRRRPPLVCGQFRERQGAVWATA